jgi:hypothetical protein
MSRDAELRIVLKELRGVGINKPVITPTGQDLRRVSWSVGGKWRSYSVPTSGSDWRGPKNARAAVRRLLRQDGLLPTTHH